MIYEGDYLRADGTTLGADDGIAVAMGMALLDSDDIPHPALEVVFTTDEEVGMLGASSLDMTLLEGRILLNVDLRRRRYIYCRLCRMVERQILSIPVEYDRVLKSGICKDNYFRIKGWSLWYWHCKIQS